MCQSYGVLPVSTCQSSLLSLKQSTAQGFLQPKFRVQSLFELTNSKPTFLQPKHTRQNCPEHSPDVAAAADVGGGRASLSCMGVPQPAHPPLPASYKVLDKLAPAAVRRAPISGRSGAIAESLLARRASHHRYVTTTRCRWGTHSSSDYTTTTSPAEDA